MEKQQNKHTPYYVKIFTIQYKLDIDNIVINIYNIY